MKAPSNAATEISDELSPDERLLWTGRPRQGFMLRASDGYLIPFSLLWGGSAIFWEICSLSILWTANADPAAGILPIFGIPFVLLGLHLIFGRFIVDVKVREKTLYAVTDRRIIIRSGWFSRTTKSLNFRSLSETSLSERSDESGTFVFGPTNFFSGLYGHSAWPGVGRYASPSFDGIPRVREVYDVIRNAQRDA